jgi:hypothetical protein
MPSMMRFVRVRVNVEVTSGRKNMRQIEYQDELWRQWLRYISSIVSRMVAMFCLDILMRNKISIDHDNTIRYCLFIRLFSWRVSLSCSSVLFVSLLACFLNHGGI